MGNPLLIRTVNDVIYDFMLSANYKSPWVFEQSYALSKDADIWETFLRDGSFASSVDRFQNSIVRPWRIEPPKGTKNQQSKIAARVVEEGIGQSMLFDDMRKRLALGRALGRSYEFPNWDYVYCSLGGFPPMDWFVPVAFENLDRRRVRWYLDSYPQANPKEAIRTHRELFSIQSNMWHRMSPDFENALIEDIHPMTEDRVGQGRGLLESSYIYAYFKAISLEKMTQGLDRWANGLLIGKVDSARLASLPKTSGSIQNSFMQMLQTMRSEHVGIIDKVDELQVVETSGTGHQLCMEAIKYFDETVERLWNGSVRPAGHATGTGARAQSETESDTSESFYQPYRKHMDEILTRDLVNFFWNHPQNRQNMLKLGLGIAEKPKFSSEAVKKKDPERECKMIGELKKAGVPLLKSEVYDKVGYSQPEPGEDVFEGQEEELVAVGPDGEMIEEKNESGDEKPPTKKKGAFAQFSAEIASLKQMVTALAQGRGQQQPMVFNVSNPPQPITMQLDHNLAEKIEARATEAFESSVNKMKIDVHVPQQPPPTVNVHVPKQEAPIVNVAAPIIHLPAPMIRNEIKMPKIELPTVQVNMPPPSKRKLDFVTDKTGRIIGAESRAEE